MTNLVCNAQGMVTSEATLSTRPASRLTLLPLRPGRSWLSQIQHTTTA